MIFKELRTKLESLWKKYHRKVYLKFLKTVGFTKDKTSRNLFRLFQFALYAIIFVFIINIFSLGTSNFGEWGDFFGGVLNPILTFLTFMGLLITIVLQQTELKESRKEFSKSANALIEQSNSLVQQNFEATFFRLLDKFENQSVHLIRIYLEDEFKEKCETNRDFRYKGFEYLRYEIYKYKEYYQKDDPDCTSEDAYYGLSRGGNTKILLEDYFKSFKFILDFISHSEIKNKGIYFKIFVSDLTNGEQVLMFYHILFEDYSKSVKNLVEAYSLFEYIGWRGLSDQCWDITKYKKSAYGDNQEILSIFEHCQQEIKNYKNNKETKS